MKSEFLFFLIIECTQETRKNFVGFLLLTESGLAMCLLLVVLSTSSSSSLALSTGRNLWSHQSATWTSRDCCVAVFMSHNFMFELQLTLHHRRGSFTVIKTCENFPNNFPELFITWFSLKWKTLFFCSLWCVCVVDDDCILWDKHFTLMRWNHVLNLKLNFHFSSSRSVKKFFWEKFLSRSS